MLHSLSVSARRFGNAVGHRVESGVKLHVGSRLKSSVPAVARTSGNGRQLSNLEFLDEDEEDEEEEERQGAARKKNAQRTVGAVEKRGQSSSKAIGGARAAKTIDEAEEDEDSMGAEQGEETEEGSDVVEDDSANIESFDMHPKLLNQLKKLGINSLFPVQVETFSRVSLGEDLIVRSRTGSGKTLAFALPVIDRIYKSLDQVRNNNKNKSRNSQPVRAVILLPTRELALQVVTEIQRVGGPSFRVVSVYGGASIGTQIRELERGADIVVGTPGRVCDLLERNVLDISSVESFVLDEADEMLKMGFEKEMDKVFSYLPEQKDRQTLLFSATVAPEIRSIAENIMNNAKMIDLVGDDAVKIPDTVTLIATPCVERSRFDAIASILKKYVGRDSRALVFVPQKAMTLEVASDENIVATGLRVEALNGDMAQKARETALQAFRKGEAQVLVATDIAARGLDIPSVELVVHYSFPQSFDSFVHRTGRTGRAGRSGSNIILFEHGKDNIQLRKLEEFCGSKFLRRQVPRAENVEQDRVQQAIQDICNVRPAAVSRFQAAALQLIEKKLENAKADKDVVDLVAATLSAFAGKHRTQKFSAITGTEDFVTLKCDLEKMNLRYPKGRLGTAEIGRLQTDIESHIWNALNSDSDGKSLGSENVVFNKDTRTKGVLSGTFVSVDRTACFVDIKPDVADLLLGNTDGLFAMLSDDTNLPEIARVSSEFGSPKSFDGRFGASSFDRGSSGYRRREGTGSYYDRQSNGNGYNSGSRGGNDYYSGPRGGSRGGYDSRSGPRSSSQSSSRSKW